MASIVLGTMTKSTRYNRKDKAFSYARLLTLVFQHFGVNFQREARKTYHQSNNLALSTIDRIAYVKDAEGHDSDEEAELEGLGAAHVKAGEGTSYPIQALSIRELL